MNPILGYPYDQRAPMRDGQRAVLVRRGVWVLETYVRGKWHRDPPELPDFMVVERARDRDEIERMIAAA